ncbi:MAG: (2Fe-2S)-binding protein [Acidobacteriota bacterium]|nr:(2Fe-2S)-binding protein [Acidobacteriota bacterium]
MADDSRSGFTRRDLVRGALVGAVAATAGAKTPAEAERAIGPGAVPITLQINGRTHRLTAEPRVVLADALRDRLGLTGTKVVCGRGACGACTVLVDGDPVCSCLLLAAEVQGRKITTIEALASDGRMQPIQEAFVAADALQCGFCTSGMVMSCKALLDRTAKPTRDEIRHAVAGNLCRCGTYPHVFEAVERAAGIRTAEGRAQAPDVAPVFQALAASRTFTSDHRVDAGVAEALDLEEA